MRMSCNGCRVLRKGCSDDCSLRPCLQWIKTPEAQANATVFLAKFYGRAGLINLVNAGPDHLRHEIFRSLLYEACGRIINPIHGAVGLIWSGNWDLCQSAVEAVLAGEPIIKVSTADDAAAEEHPIIPLKGCDIRHFAKLSNGLNTNNYNYNYNNNSNIHGVRASRNRFKRAGVGAKVGLVNSQLAARDVMMSEPTKFSITGWGEFDGSDNTNDDDGDADGGLQLRRAPSHDSFSVETVEPTLVNPVDQGRVVKSENHHPEVAAAEEDADLLLDLTLGWNPVRRT